MQGNPIFSHSNIANMPGPGPAPVQANCQHLVQYRCRQNASLWSGPGAGILPAPFFGPGAGIFWILGKLTFQSSRNGSQNLPFCLGSIRTPLLFMALVREPRFLDFL